MSVTQGGTVERPVLEVEVTGERGGDVMRREATRALERLLGLRIDLAGFYRLAARRREIRALVERFRGVKPPRVLTPFEALSNGILFQQISLAAGMSLHNALVEARGPAAPGGHAFPRPEDVAGDPPESFRPLGLSRQKGRAISELGSRIVNGLDLERAGRMNDEEASLFLQELRGVGRWTAQYALLRGYGRIDVFPCDDVGARKRVGKWMKVRGALDYEGMRAISDGWRPYGGMMYFHSLLGGLADKGFVD